MVQEPLDLIRTPRQFREWAEVQAYLDRLPRLHPMTVDPELADLPAVWYVEPDATLMSVECTDAA